MHAYAVTFAPNSLPPVNAFWSITMYDGRTQFLVANPIDRYLINAPMLPAAPIARPRRAASPPASSRPIRRATRQSAR
jgi:hypothetical protein